MDSSQVHKLVISQWLKNPSTFSRVWWVIEPAGRVSFVSPTLPKSKTHSILCMFSRLVCSNRVYRHHPPNRTLRPEHLHVYLFLSCYYLDHSALRPLPPWVSSHSLSSNCITIKHICVSASPQHQILVINICGGHNHYFVNIMDQFPCYYYHLKYSAQLPSLPPQFSDHHCESSDQFSIQWKHLCLVSTPQILAQPWQWLLDLADMLQVKLWNVSFFPEQDLSTHTHAFFLASGWNSLVLIKSL